MFILMGSDSKNRGVKWSPATEKDELKHFLHSLQLKSASGCPVSVWSSADKEGVHNHYFLFNHNCHMKVREILILFFFFVHLQSIFGQELVNLILCIKSYWQANVKSCGHPAQDGWIQVLGTVSCSHHHHLRFEASQWNTLIKSQIIAEQQDERDYY